MIEVLSHELMSPNIDIIYHKKLGIFEVKVWDVKGEGAVLPGSIKNGVRKRIEEFKKANKPIIHFRFALYPIFKQLDVTLDELRSFVKQEHVVDFIRRCAKEFAKEAKEALDVMFVSKYERM